MSYKIGIDCVLGYKAGGVSESGDFVEADNIRDLAGNFNHAEADATTRANQGWRATVPTLKEAEITGQMVYDTSDPHFTAFRNAWTNRAPLGIAMLDGPLDTGAGWVFDANVINFSINQAMEDVVLVDITLKPSYSPADPPEWVTSGVNEGVDPDEPEE